MFLKLTQEMLASLKDALSFATKLRDGPKEPLQGWLRSSLRTGVVSLRFFRRAEASARRALSTITRDGRGLPPLAWKTQKISPFLQAS